MTVFVCSLIVPARIASLTAATKASRSAVAGTSESRSTAAPGRRPAAIATAAFMRASRAPLFSQSSWRSG